MCRPRICGLTGIVGLLVFLCEGPVGIVLGTGVESKGFSTAAESRPVSSSGQDVVPNVYRDGRPAATLRLEAKDHGVVLRHGDGPNQCDIRGARDVWVYEVSGTYYMHYDAAGAKGWLASLAVSKDLTDWIKKGPVLNFGKQGEDDSGCAWTAFFKMTKSLVLQRSLRICAKPALHQSVEQSGAARMATWFPWT